MKMAEQPQQPPTQGAKAGIKKASAGVCEKCGFYKTWQFKIRNPSSGRMMPAHINSMNGADAEVLGEGDCPMYLQKPAGQAQRPAVAPQGPAALVPADNALDATIRAAGGTPKPALPEKPTSTSMMARQKMLDDIISLAMSLKAKLNEP